MTHNVVKSIGTDLEVTEKIELTEDVKRAITNTFHIFKKVE